MLAFGTLGAVLSLGLLLMIPTDGATRDTTQLISGDLPVLIFALAMGFGAGMLMVALWSVVQRLFAVGAPRA